jgi:hypothetical protein
MWFSWLHPTSTSTKQHDYGAVLQHATFIDILAEYCATSNQPIFCTHASSSPRLAFVNCRLNVFKPNIYRSLRHANACKLKEVRGKIKPWRMKLQWWQSGKFMAELTARCASSPLNNPSRYLKIISPTFILNALRILWIGKCCFILSH